MNTEEYPVDVKAIRIKLDMSQEKFAETFQLPLNMLQRWEEGTEQPPRPIKLFLRLLDRFPEVVMEEVLAERRRLGVAVGVMGSKTQEN